MRAEFLWFAASMTLGLLAIWWQPFGTLSAWAKVPLSLCALVIIVAVHGFFCLESRDDDDERKKRVREDKGYRRAQFGGYYNFEQSRGRRWIPGKDDYYSYPGSRFFPEDRGVMGGKARGRWLATSYLLWLLLQSGLVVAVVTNSFSLLPAAGFGIAAFVALRALTFGLGCWSGAHIHLGRCSCRLCGSSSGDSFDHGRHDWEGCKCRWCGGTRDKDHTWDACLWSDDLPGFLCPKCQDEVSIQKLRSLGHMPPPAAAHACVAFLLRLRLLASASYASLNDRRAYVYKVLDLVKDLRSVADEFCNLIDASDLSSLTRMTSIRIELPGTCSGSAWDEESAERMREEIASSAAILELDFSALREAATRRCKTASRRQRS